MTALTDAQLARFAEDGFLVIEDVLDRHELETIRTHYTDLVEEVSESLVADGKLRPLQGTTFSARYIEALQQLDEMYDLYKHLDISVPLMNEPDPTATMNASPEVFDLLRNPKLVDIAEVFVGPEVFSNPVQHVRIKPPANSLPTSSDSNIGTTGWHQDSAVIEPNGDDTNMLTVWVAITDATVHNGCLVAVRGSHRSDRTIHCPGKVYPTEIYIPEALVEDSLTVPLEVKAGGIVILHKLTEHASLPNQTDDIRWSFDLRYQPIGQPTGRDVLPGFVVRSAADPDSVLTDPAAWAQLWWDARDRMASGEVDLTFGLRWQSLSDHPVCA